MESIEKYAQEIRTLAGHEMPFHKSCIDIHVDEGSPCLAQSNTLPPPDLVPEYDNHKHFCVSGKTILPLVYRNYEACGSRSSDACLAGFQKDRQKIAYRIGIGVLLYRLCQ